MKISCVNNMAAACIKLGHYSDSIQICDEAIEAGLSNAKTHYRPILTMT